MTTTCTLHGLPLTTRSGGCATCVKAAHECDYGACRRTPVSIVEATTYIAQRASRDARRSCGKHAEEMASAYRATGLPNLTVTVRPA